MLPSHLCRGHVANRAVRLYSLQLVQAPVKLLHGLHGQLLVGFIWEQTHGHVFRIQLLMHGQKRWSGGCSADRGTVMFHGGMTAADVAILH